MASPSDRVSLVSMADAWANTSSTLALLGPYVPGGFVLTSFAA